MIDESKAKGVKTLGSNTEGEAVEFGLRRMIEEAKIFIRTEEKRKQVI